MSVQRDRNGIVISISKVYPNVNQIKGPSWYDHRSFEPQYVSPEHYYLVKKVGRGKYSTVFKGFYKKREEVAIKILVPLDPKRYLREIKILINLGDGPNIVKLKDLIQDPVTQIYSLVFEWVDFYDWRKLYSTFTIQDIRMYMYKLLLALEHAHSNGVMHRDIKPQNIAIDKTKKKLRLLDWGLADFYMPQTKYNSHVATRVFKPPELLINYPYYDYSLDIWSAGLTFSIMMFRQIVIGGAENDAKQLLKVAELVGGNGIIRYADDVGVELDPEAYDALKSIRGSGWGKFISQADPELCPDDAIDLLERMMTIDHRERITAKEALGHRFFKPYLDKLRAQKACRY